MNVKASICFATFALVAIGAMNVGFADETIAGSRSAEQRHRISVAMMANGATFTTVPGVSNIAMYSGAGLFLDDTVPAAVDVETVTQASAEVVRKHDRVYLNRSVIQSGWRSIDHQRQAKLDAQFLAEREKVSVPPPTPAPEPVD